MYLYLLRNLATDRPNPVWAKDITYIPIARGFISGGRHHGLVLKKKLSRHVSDTLNTGFCVEATEQAIETYGCPMIFHADQAGQFTSADFTGLLKPNNIQISMDGKGNVGRADRALSATTLGSATGPMASELEDYTPEKCIFRTSPGRRPNPAK